MTRAMYAAARVLGLESGALRLGVPNDMHRSRCEERRSEAEQAAAAAFGHPVSIALLVDAAEGAAVPVDTSGEGSGGRGGRGPAVFEDEMVDPAELMDAPDAPVTSTKDLMLTAFPGAQLVEEDRP